MNIALVDMDGTIADYNRSLLAELEKIKSPHEPEIKLFGSDPWIESRRHLITSQPGFFRNLRPMKTGMFVYNMLQYLQFDIHILTKGPGTKPLAWKEKLEWCHEHVPDAKVTITSDKSLTYGKVLVDDYPPYVFSWLKHRPRGLVIMPKNEFNCDVVHPQIIHVEYGTRDFDYVSACLQVVKDRKYGEPLTLPLR